MKSKFKNILMVLGIAIMIFSAYCIVYYIWVPSASFFQSDCSDTLYWAQASVSSKSIVNPDFNYAAMLPFGGVSIMVPLVALFGAGITAHKLGMIIFALIMISCMFVLFKLITNNISFSAFSVGVISLILTSSSKMREIFYEHVIYYSLAGVLICILFSLYIHYKKCTAGIKEFSPKIFLKICKTPLILTAFFSFGAGLDGFQIIATAIIPIIAAIALKDFLDKKSLISKDNFYDFIFITDIVTFAIIGYIFIAFVLKGHAGYADAYSDYSEVSEWLQNLMKLPEHWFSLFGLENMNGIPMFTLTSLGHIIRIFSSVLIAIIPIISLVKYNKLTDSLKILVLIHFSLVAVVLFGYVFGMLSSADWRLCPIVFSSLVVTLASISGFAYSLPLKRLLIISGTVLFAFSSICFTEIYKLMDKTIKDNPKYDITKVLLDNNLTFGYSSFWSSQTISVLSDGKIRCANVDIDEKGVWTWNYQSDKNWYQKNASPTGEYFLLVSDDELPALLQSDDYALIESSCIKEYKSNGYRIYIVNNNDFINN